MKKTEAPDEKPTEPTQPTKSKEEIKAETLEKLMKGENLTSEEFKAITLPEIKEIAKNLGITIGNKRKDTLVKEIIEHQQTAPLVAPEDTPIPRSPSPIRQRPTSGEAFPREEREDEEDIGAGRKIKKTRKIGCGCGKMKNRDKYKRFLK